MPENYNKARMELLDNEPRTQATNYLIGRVNLVNEETGEQTPIDARTRPEAVTTTEDAAGGVKKTLQDKLEEYNDHVNNLAIHSDAYIKPMWQVTIPAIGWVASAPDESEFPYCIELEYDGVLETHNAEVTVDRDSINDAWDCGLSPTMETMHNGLKFWARKIPNVDILCHMTLVGAGGISGGNTGGTGSGGTGSGGTYVLPIASETQLGGVMIGENIDIDEDGRITPTGATLSEDQTATSQDIQDIVSDVFGDETK